MSLQVATLHAANTANTNMQDAQLAVVIRGSAHREGWHGRCGTDHGAGFEEITT